MKPVIRDNGKNIMTTPLCGNCGKVLHYYHYVDKQGVPCYDPRVIVENFCPECGYEVEGYKKEPRIIIDAPKDKEE